MKLLEILQYMQRCHMSFRAPYIHPKLYGLLRGKSLWWLTTTVILSIFWMNDSACYDSGVKRTSWYFKLPTTWLCSQESVQANMNKNQSTKLLDLCDGNPQRVSIQKGPVMQKVFFVRWRHHVPDISQANRHRIHADHWELLSNDYIDVTRSYQVHSFRN